MPVTDDTQLAHGDLIARMTLTEKAALCSGANFWQTEAVERLGIEPIMLTDGPHGLRKQGGAADHLGLHDSLPATCFPTAAALAQAWDPQLAEQVGERLGAEAAAADVAVLLGPGLNIVRDPRGGRSFEYFSEDPRLSGDLAAAMVRGIQSTGVAACPKHFAVNSQEHLRMSIDEVVDERSLREIYLEGFRRVVEQAAPRVLMTAYNRVNGTYANEHSGLLAEILRGEWGFDGVVVTDWGGNHDRVAALLAGNHLEMPSSGGITDAEIVAAVRDGRIDEEILDARVDALLDLVLAAPAVAADAAPVDADAQHAAAVEAAQRSMVLLKNDDAVLPLAPGARVAVVGDFAATPRYQGAGSSLVNPTRVDDALTALRASHLDVVATARGFDRFGRRSTRLRDEAVAAARQAETALLFLGLDESSEAEGVDREHLRLPANQLELVEAITAVHDRVVVVLAGGAPVELPFADDVAAVLHTSLAGQGGGTAVVDVLTGAHNPGGRLAVTWPRTLAEVPTARWFPGREAASEHREGVYVGYRYYATAAVAPRYCFGHGLSYTTFAYAELEVDDDAVHVTVHNTGAVTGHETVQVYAGPLDSPVARPRTALAGFATVRLGPGESRRVRVALDGAAFRYWSVSAGRWVAPSGRYRIDVGASVQDVRLSAEIERPGETDVPVTDSETLPAYRAGAVRDLSDAAWATLLGRTPPPSRWTPGRPLGLDDTVAQLRHTNLLGRATLGVLRGVRRLLLALRRPHAANNVMFVVNLPFAKIPGFTGDRVSRRTVQRFLRWTHR